MGKEHKKRHGAPPKSDSHVHINIRAAHPSNNPSESDGLHSWREMRLALSAPLGLGLVGPRGLKRGEKKTEKGC